MPRSPLNEEEIQGFRHRVVDVASAFFVERAAFPHRAEGRVLIGRGAKRWSEDDGSYYAGWSGVSEPRDLKLVSDTIVNVQTGTGNRIEFWDNNGTPLKSKGKVRRYIDIGRLTKGR